MFSTKTRAWDWSMAHLLNICKQQETFMFQLQTYLFFVTWMVMLHHYASSTATNGRTNDEAGTMCACAGTNSKNHKFIVKISVTGLRSDPRTFHMHRRSDNNVWFVRTFTALCQVTSFVKLYIRWTVSNLYCDQVVWGHLPAFLSFKPES